MSSKLEETIGIVWSYCMLGALFGLISAICQTAGNVLAGLHGLLFGGVIGFACSPVGLFCLWRKKLQKARWILIATTVPVTLLTSLSEYGFFVVVGAPVGVFLLTTLALRYYLHDRPPPKGFCRGCEYNLTGNVSGICPECGTPISNSKATRID